MYSVALQLTNIATLVILTGVACIYDARSRRIPNWISVLLFGLWFVLTLLSAIFANLGLVSYGPFDVIRQAGIEVLTSACVTFLLAGICWLCKKLWNSPAPLGMGDIKLMLSISLYLGPALVAICLIVACFSFCLYVLLRRVVTKTKDTTAPFVPFIFIGVIVSVIVSFII